MPFMMEGALDQESLEQQLIEGQNVGNDINMDDLFGDDPSVTVSLPMDKRLPRRLSELHESGCSQ